MIVTVFDYGAGNLHSLTKALALDGDEVRIETDPRAALATDLLVLPGVGAFASAAERLEPGRVAMRQALEDGLPCLGICLGMQLMFDASDEGSGAGLGVFPGRVTRLESRVVPQIGWNTLQPVRARDAVFGLAAQGGAARTDPLFERAPLDFAYFAHSFACRPQQTGVVTAWTTHESDRFAAAVRRDRVVGVQFHPEKSSRSGVRFVRAFLDEVRAAGAPSRAGFANCHDVTSDLPTVDSFVALASAAGPGAMPCS